MHGNTLFRRVATNGVTTAIYVDASGRQSLRMLLPNGQAAADRGESRLESDRVCVTWGRINQGRPLCYVYYLQNDGALVAVEQANVITPARYELRPGNSEGL